MLCGEPVDAEREPGAVEVRDHLDEVRPDEVRQEEAVVEERAPADERASVGLLPEPGDEGSHEELLHEAHARVRWHLEAAELDEAEPAARRLGGVQLVDAELGPVRVAGDVHQEVSQNAVDQPGRRLPTSRRERGEGDVQLVELTVARLVHPRVLRRRPDEEPREQVRERGMVLPVAQQAAEHVRAAQERAVERVRRAHDDLIPAARADGAPVDQELLGAEPGGAGFLVQSLGDLAQLRPGPRRVDVHLDHAGIGRDLHAVQLRVRRGRIALDPHRGAELRGHVFDRRDELEVVLGVGDRRHEDVEEAVARLGGERRANGPLGRRVRAPLRCVPRPRLAPRDRLGQAAGRSRRIPLEHGRDVGGRKPGQLVERQPEPQRRVSGDEEE